MPGSSRRKKQKQCKKEKKYRLSRKAKITLVMALILTLIITLIYSYVNYVLGSPILIFGFPFDLSYFFENFLWLLFPILLVCVLTTNGILKEE